VPSIDSLDISSLAAAVPDFGYLPCITDLAKAEIGMWFQPPVSEFMSQKWV